MTDLELIEMIQVMFDMGLTDDEISYFLEATK